MSKYVNIGSWILQILLAVLFIMMGAQKLMGEAEVAANFVRWGMPSFMLPLIGALEVAGGLGLLIPRLAGLAAAGLIPVMIGALFTHLSHGEMDMAPVPFVVLIVLAVIAYVRNPLAMLKKTSESPAQS
ncbi:MAG: DoxX family protein [Acidobacteria bacterium]|nr:DoxX family protein [Acidobacteriota bacterium]